MKDMDVAYKIFADGWDSLTIEEQTYAVENRGVITNLTNLTHAQLNGGWKNVYDKSNV